MAKFTFDYTKASDVEALTEVVAITLDELKAKVDQLLLNFDIEKCPEEHLNVMLNLLGVPVYREDDVNFNRIALKNAISLYKTKGTIDSIKVLFYTLKLGVNIVPLWTPDFSELVPIFPVYIKVTLPTNIPPEISGFRDVTVQNPDNQSFNDENGYQYIG